MSDEERMAIEHLKNYPINWLIENVNESAIKIILNLIEKQSKEIEELKEDKYGLEEEVQIQAKQLIEIDGNYISKEESEQKERKAYIKGTNDADELCNKKWEHKIKAKIEELNKDFKEYENGQEWEIQDEIRGQIDVLESLLEKE